MFYNIEIKNQDRQTARLQHCRTGRLLKKTTGEAGIKGIGLEEDEGQVEAFCILLWTGVAMTG